MSTTPEKDYTATVLAPVQREALVRAADRLEAACDANVPAPDFEERDAARALIMAVRINVGMDEPAAVTTTEWGVVIDSIGSADMAESESEARSWLAAGQGLSLVRVAVTEWPRVNTPPAQKHSRDLLDGKVGEV